MSESRTYIAIDLKSFYASAECVARGLDPLTANLVVADPTRTEKTICLAVSPALKAFGIPGRARLFEVVQKVREVNARRRPEDRIDYIVAPPRMKMYMDVSSKVYATYLKYVAAEDIHVYSIDEVFMDVTAYLDSYRCTAHELAIRMIRDVLRTTGITATAGIGTNMYLAKIAMDIEAKHTAADADGVRIAELDERSYREKYWGHTPLTDFWRVGHGLAAKLNANGMYTMGDVALMSERNEEVLYRLFGVNAELLIDHAWGWEPCTIAQIKAYKPSAHSLSVGQVLTGPYETSKARVVIKEMADSLSLDLVDKKLACDQIVLTIGYDIECLQSPVGGRAAYRGAVVNDYYGRPVPKPAHGSINLKNPTSSTDEIVAAASDLFDRIIDPALLVRRMYIVANHAVPEDSVEGIQLDLFEEQRPDSDKERKRQEAILSIKKKFGKNAILKGLNFEEGATQVERNAQVGGHKA
ncbi:MAG: DNA methylase [Bacteroidales bacterium]|nr:DNA methylase [Candidatus Cryptobacteroides caccocaballi]